MVEWLKDFSQDWRNWAIAIGYLVLMGVLGYEDPSKLDGVAQEVGTSAALLAAARSLGKFATKKEV